VSFSPGNDCRVTGSGGWCVTYEDCRDSCQLSGQSTSAQLRQVQAALAASQQDLTAMQQQRDEALVEVRRLTAELRRLGGEP